MTKETMKTDPKIYSCAGFLDWFMLIFTAFNSTYEMKMCKHAHILKFDPINREP